MAQSSFNVVDSLGLVQDFWSPIFEKELRENTLWAGMLMDRKRSMANVKGGQTLKISKINKPTSAIKTIGTDADTFESNLIDTTQVDLVINKRSVSAYEFEDLAILMSQLEDENSEIRESLLSDIKEQTNDYIKSQIVPSASTPDHVITSVTDFNLAELSAVRALGSVAKWGSAAEPWMLLAAPSYYSDLLDDTTISASDTMGIGESPMVQGQFARKRMNFNIVEDNSLAVDTAFAFIPSFMSVIMGQPVFKLSDLHAQKKFGFVLSVDMVFGLVQLDDTRVISIA